MLGRVDDVAGDRGADTHLVEAGGFALECELAGDHVGLGGPEVDQSAVVGELSFADVLIVRTALGAGVLGDFELVAAELDRERCDLKGGIVLGLAARQLDLCHLDSVIEADEQVAGFDAVAGLDEGLGDSTADAEGELADIGGP
ncbi:MAG: hypothetical protein AAFU70_02365 [Planctomycetota bacterium]